jgi:AcrR family transcriptional regulator
MARPKDPLAHSALIAAARAEFVRSGIQKARIEDLTRACGLSKGAFYLHFESKEALFRGLVSALGLRFEEVRSAREQAWGKVMAGGHPPHEDPAPFVAELLEIEGSSDRKMLELFWDWRDVIDVLLRGSQGTEFEQVMWAILDREVVRVEGQCVAMTQAGLMRDDVEPAVLGSMIVGTWLMVARRMTTLQDKPDLEPWLRSLQSVIADGASSGTLRVHRDAAAKRSRTSAVRRRTAPNRNTLRASRKEPS